jgi:carboxyl-terminal processing protease
MRVLRTLIVVLFVALGFLGGYFAGWYMHGENVVSLTAGERDAAAEAGRLQQRIIEELQGRYYKPVDVDKLSQGGINGTLKTLKDPYTVYLTPRETRELEEKQDGEYSGIGATLRKTKQGLEITGVFDGSPAKAAGLKRGDVIVSVDGKSTVDAAEDASVARIKGEEGTDVVLGVLPGGARPEKRVTITRRRIETPETSQKMLSARGTPVGYVQLFQFGGHAADQVTEAVEELGEKGARWYILDLRYNLGGLLSQAVDVTGIFQRGVVTSTEGLHSELEVYEATDDPVTAKPMVLLVNGWSASASEIVTGALKDHGRAEVIGTRTYGKGLVQSFVPLGNGSALKLTTAVYFTPDGTNIHKKGIAPDIVVKDRPKSKKDEQLQAALAFIAGEQ